MKFFFDRNISVHLASMIDGYDRDNTIDHQDKDPRFSAQTDDVTLINTVAADDPRPVWVSADIKQRQRVPAERIALAESGMTAVFMRGGFHKLEFHDQARLLLNVWPTVVLQCGICKEPTVFEVGNRVGSTKVERIGPTKGLLLSRKTKR